MKIILIKGENPIRIYHNPREVIVRPLTNKVETYNTDGTILETFSLVKKELGWLEDPSKDCMEIQVTLYVEE